MQLQGPVVGITYAAARACGGHYICSCRITYAGICQHFKGRQALLKYKIYKITNNKFLICNLSHRYLEIDIQKRGYYIAKLWNWHLFLFGFYTPYIKNIVLYINFVEIYYSGVFLLLKKWSNLCGFYTLYIKKDTYIIQVF